MDQDLDLDRVLSNQGSDTMSDILNEGGAFGPGIPIGTGRTPTPFAAGDVDGDGTIDLAVGHIDTDDVLILFNDCLDPCPFDLTGDLVVGVTDLLEVLAGWGCPFGTPELLAVLAAWGPCP